MCSSLLIDCDHVSFTLCKWAIDGLTEDKTPVPEAMKTGSITDPSKFAVFNDDKRRWEWLGIDVKDLS
jgi:hypothetical protein